MTSFFDSSQASHAVVMLSHFKTQARFIKEASLFQIPARQNNMAKARDVKWDVGVWNQYCHSCFILVEI